MSKSNSMVWQAAREYAKNGIYVFPLYVSRKAGGKKDVRPLGLWRDISSTSLADIGAWEQEFPDAGLGIDCGKSGLVVIDCDGEEGISNWNALDPDAPLWTVRTPGGGLHDYYRADPAHVIGNDQDGKVAPSVDVRGLGGFVIAPPTGDGTGAWAGRGEPRWTTDAIVPTVVVERMKSRSSRLVLAGTDESPTLAGVGDDLFDDARDERRFTDEQATEFIRKAVGKLKTAESGLNGAINAFAMSCAHFPWLVDREKCAGLVQRHLGERMGWAAPDRDDRKTIDSAYSATEAGRSWVAVRGEAAQIVATGEDRLRIGSAADMAYWLQENAGRGRMSGFFMRGGQMVHTPRVNEIGYVPAPEGAENGPAEIRAVAGPVLAAKLQYLYDCFKVDKEGAESPAMFPKVAAQVAVDAPEALTGLRPLRGLTSTPMVREDGSLLDSPGYDQASGFLFLPEDGIAVPAISERPDATEVGRARALLLNMVQDFPFAGDDDRANYLGLLLTPLLRQVAPPSYKLFGIGAHQPGSGKSLLAEIAGIIHGAVLRSEVPEDEAEWRKQTFSVLATTSAPLVVLDNVYGILKSSVLAGVLTAGRELTDRELGSSKTITVANDRVWVVTGNNLSIGGDLVRRTITIIIDPDRPNPEQRTDFAIPDLKGWVAERRNEILWALLTLIRAWVAEGMPEPMRKQSDSFARWERVVAGVLSVAGIPGSFDAESGRKVAAGGDDDEMVRVLGVLRERFKEEVWSVARALEPKAEEGWLMESRDWLPGPVLDKMVRSEASGRKAFGWWLKNRIGRWVTDSDGKSFVIREAGSEKHVSLWMIEVRD